MKIKVILCLSIIATIISIAAVSFVLLRCEPFKADWMAMLIGILSLLTASLIGWQIYRTIELERTIKRFDTIVNDRTLAITHDINHIITAFEYRMSSFRPVIDPGSQENSIMYLMLALEEVTKIETPGANKESVDKIMDDFMKVVDMHKDKQPLKLNREEQDRYLLILRKVNHKDALFLTKYISHVS